MGNELDYIRLRQYVEAFIKYELCADQIDPREHLECSIFRKAGTIPDGTEGFKYRIPGIWEDLLTKNEQDPYKYSNSVREIINPSLGLFKLNVVKGLHSYLGKASVDDLELALTALYEEDDDAASFSHIVQLVGKNFQLLGFLCFLKNPDHYMPISPDNFKEFFGRLGIDVEFSGKCSWELYTQYNRWLTDVMHYLKKHISSEITLLDAHSFVWRIDLFENFLDVDIVLYNGEQFAQLVSVRDNKDSEVYFYNQKKTKLLGPGAWEKGILQKPTIKILYQPTDAVVVTNRQLDYEVQQEISEDSESDNSIKPSYKGGKEPRPEARIKNGAPYYPRNKAAARDALILKGYQCEIDPMHESFLNRFTGKKYMEAHHLVPMEYQDTYDINIDRAENIVCLCSNCHNEIHYGCNYKVLIEKLYRGRSELIKSIGINDSLEQVLLKYE